MQYSLSDQPVATATVETFSPLQLAELNNEIMEAYENLTDSVKELDAVQEIMENIQTSQMLLAKYGKDAIPQLNLDKGLEALCKVPENLIIIEKASKAFEDNAQSMLAKFIQFIKTWISKISNFIKVVFARFDPLYNKISTLHDYVRNDLDETKTITALKFSDASASFAQLHSIREAFGNLSTKITFNKEKVKLEDLSAIDLPPEAVAEQSFTTGTVKDLGWNRENLKTLLQNFAGKVWSPKSIQRNFDERIKPFFDTKIRDMHSAEGAKADLQLLQDISRRVSKLVSLYTKNIKQLMVTLMTVYNTQDKSKPAAQI